MNESNNNNETANGTKPDGRHEFIADTKQKLIDAIQDFMKSDKEGWCIV